ncbi:MAG: ribosomal protein S18 acetylase RimI-like enzyme [Saprospiraceae bacterium]|jgi:ribosomal protein S18 acetylase RimI-like enzyme
MEIKTLEKSSLANLTTVFNEAFSDYIIPIQWTEAILSRKFKADNVDLSLSPGYFVDGKLCGFIFHFIGTREKSPVVWNGGTGVAPDQRGQGVTTKLYEFILPFMQESGFDRTVLEVIEGNNPAIHIYQKNGFSTTRKLDCYKGTIEAVAPPEGIFIKEINTINWKTFHSFRSWQPTFQNNDPKIDMFRNETEVIGAYDKDRLVGYIIGTKNRETGTVFQFAVKENYRNRGIGKALFARAGQGKKVHLNIINVDARHEASKVFFEKIGFEKTVSQFEMIKSLV